MRSHLLRPALAGLVLAFAGCAHDYRWGATDDPEWTPRVGSATLAEATRVLGQPVEKFPLPSGDLKVRWYARPMTMSAARGTMEDDSIQHTEDRAFWRDMKFDKNLRLTRAWMSDQRRLIDSEAP